MSGFGKFFYAETGIAATDALAAGFDGRLEEGMELEAVGRRGRFGPVCAPARTEVEASALPCEEDAAWEWDEVFCYDADGNRVPAPVVAVDPEEPAKCRYEWSGRELASETELFYARARCFDPCVGRWISGDPLVYEASDEHLST